MANQDETSTFKINLSKVVSFDIRIFDDPKFSLFKYQEVEYVVKMFQGFANQLVLLDDLILQSYPGYQNIDNIYTNLVKNLELIVAHASDKNSAATNATTYKDKISGLMHDFLSDQRDLPLFLAGLQSFDFVDAMKSSVEETLKIADRIKGTELLIDDLITAVNQKIVTFDVSRYNTKFKESSDKYKFFAKLWLGASVVLFILTLSVLFGYNLLFLLEDKNSTFDLVKYLSTKILILTLLISAILWSAKIYKVNKNLSIIYEHKSNSLATFTEFVNSAQTPETKDFVLQETTKTIFTLPESGLIGSENLPVQSLSKVIDLAKSTVRKS